jgi:hypothetical protein
MASKAVGWWACFDPLPNFTTVGYWVVNASTFSRVGKTFFVLPTQLNVECSATRGHKGRAHPTLAAHGRDSAIAVLTLLLLRACGESTSNACEYRGSLTAAWACR